MEKSIKFSIVIAAYNVADYISTTLNSLINQTIEDIEIICVNDGSTDNTLDILNTYSHIDHRIKVISKPNGGSSSARNIGLKASQGRYILFVDADDYLVEVACERLYSMILNDNPDIIMFGANIFPEYPPAAPWLWWKLSTRDGIFENDSIRVLLEENGAYPFAWRNCYRRDILVKNDIAFPDKIRFAEDTAFQFCAFPFADKIVSSAEKLYNYRWYREDSLMHNTGKDLIEKYKWHVKTIQYIADYWERKEILEDNAFELFKWSIIFVAGKEFYGIKNCNEKFIIAKTLYHIWYKYRCLPLKNKLPLKHRIAFEYIHSLASKEVFYEDMDR